MHPFARQLLGWQATNTERRAAALVLEVKGDLCHDIRRMLTELDRGGDYIELSLDGRLPWVYWFNTRRLLGPLGDIPPAEFEAQYYAQAAVA